MMKYAIFHCFLKNKPATISGTAKCNAKWNIEGWCLWVQVIYFCSNFSTTAALSLSAKPSAEDRSSSDFMGANKFACF
jgi:hypothetical protein